MGMALMINVLGWQQQQTCLLGFGRRNSRCGWPDKASCQMLRLSTSAIQSKAIRSRMIFVSNDTLAERLRRRPAQLMGSPHVGSHPTGVAVGLGCSSLCIFWPVPALHVWPGDDERWKRASKSASAGNRTRVTSMATMYSTTRPLMLMCF